MPDPNNPAADPLRLRRRTIASALSALALGAATTVAIAWGFAIGVDPVYHAGQSTMRRTPRAAWNVRQYESTGALTEEWIPYDWYVVPNWDEHGVPANELAAVSQTVEQMEQSITNMLSLPGIVVSERSPMVASDERVWSKNGPGNLTEHHRGWPLLALGCARVIPSIPDYSSTANDDLSEWSWGILFRSSRDASWDVDCLALPLRPLFPGFYLNTALFASLWWALLFFRPLRRRRRIARGQCPACAYSLAGLPPGTPKCPECGSPVP